MKDLHEHNRRKREALLNLPSLESTLPTINGETGTRIRHQIFLHEALGAKRTHQERVTTLGDDAHEVSQINMAS
jgi:hypothetical protein